MFNRCLLRCRVSPTPASRKARALSAQGLAALLAWRGWPLAGQSSGRARLCTALSPLPSSLPALGNPGGEGVPAPALLGGTVTDRPVSRCEPHTKNWSSVNPPQRPSHSEDCEVDTLPGRREGRDDGSGEKGHWDPHHVKGVTAPLPWADGSSSKGDT